MDLMFPFFGIVLDLVDTLVTVVALVAIWRMWLAPRPATTALTAAADLERFLAAARQHQVARRPVCLPRPYLER